MLEKVKFDGSHSAAMFAKNLFLHNKKKKELVYLVIAAHDTNIDMKGLTTHLKAGSGNLRAGDPDVMEAMLGVKKGAVNLFAIMNDTAKKVILIVDQRLMSDFQQIAFHPMQNDATLREFGKQNASLFHPVYMWNWCPSPRKMYDQGADRWDFLLKL